VTSPKRWRPAGSQNVLRAVSVGVSHPPFRHRFATSFGKIAFSLLTLVAAAQRTSAQESSSYTYDVLGRLVTVEVVDGPNDGVVTATSFDPAGNRTNVTVTGSPDNAAGGVVVIPLMGFVVIPVS